MGKKKYFDIHGPVFWPASVLIVLFIAVTLIVGSPMAKVFSTVQSSITDNFGWLFIVAVNAFIVFCLYVGFGRFGKIRLGGDDAEKEFSTPAWFAMLFSAGMGIGILFWGVAEPVTHYINPPFGQGRTLEAAENAMNLTFLHWGFHAWGIYALVGLALAFFAFNRNQPLTIRSVFLPVLGKRVHGPIGNIIDVFAVIATLFGLATSLGLGVTQVSGGLNHVFGTPNTVWMQVGLIIAITLVATVSVVTGIKKGVRILSEWNVRIAALLFILVLLLGPTLFIFKSFIQNVGNYLNEILMVSSWTEAYRDRGWQGGWTVFYWAWWISWSPFVGMFIARVSKGRTIREFVFGVLLVPSVVMFLWLTAFGGSAVFFDIKGIAPGIGDRIIADESTALFVFFEQFPWSSLLSVIGILLVISFFVTSSDSGSLVIDSITAGGKLDAPVGQRIFWANIEGAVAAVLLLGGGLTALQTAAVSTGLPFLFVLLVMMYSLYRGLSSELTRAEYLSKSQDKKSYEKKIAGMIAKRLTKKEGRK
ncbi:BCCT family transporter [Geofilum rhodophaeum]|uniref:BCCT family transporter n=1 Tax=Geofilum rhodophaeum TaxID=1965019 RepID=UPI000B51F2D9|nr:BCCT family transporter [Geofilum rhodophaeum]